MRLSVVIPSHEEGASIRRTLEAMTAVLQDADIDYEVLVVDDASTDDTSDVVRALAADDARIRYLRSEYPRGFGFTVRYGLDHFTCEAVAIVMADGADSPEGLVR